MSALPLESGHCLPTTLAACYLAVVKPASIGNVILVTKQASGTAKIDPLMAAFNTLMATNPASRFSAPRKPKSRSHKYAKLFALKRNVSESLITICALAGILILLALSFLS
jgi:hypothetical protein